MSVPDPLLPDTDDLDDSQQPPVKAGRSPRLWALVVGLLLLLLMMCGVLQFLLPSARSGSVADSTRGIVPVFGVYGLTQPLGVAAGPQGEIVVSDTGVQRAFLFDKDGRLVSRLGDERPGSKVFSVDGALFISDSIYVCDWSLRRIWMFRRDGSLQGFFPKDPMDAEFGEGGFTPYDITMLGSDFLVTSRDGVYRFDARGDLKGRFGEAAGGRSLDFPNGIAVDEERDRVYVCDTLNRRVVAYDLEGHPVWTLGRPDRDSKIVSFFGLPRGVTITSRGVVIADTFHHELILLDSEGGLLGTYGERGVVDGKLNFPEALDTAPDGLVYVADRENNRIQVVRLEEPVAPDVTMQREWRTNHERLLD